MSYRLHPHARRVTSPSWVLKHRLLLRLHRCSAAAGRATTRTRSAVTDEGWVPYWDSQV
jgi:hypothetical protein